MAKANNRNNSPGFVFDDPDSRTRKQTLDVVYARSERIDAFNLSLFSGFETFHALTYTPSIPMIVELLRSFDYDAFECIFGHGGIVKHDLATILSFQTAVDAALNKGFVAVRAADERGRLISDLVVQGKVNFYVVKDAIAHAKIYLLERDGLRRVIVGSANLSETAFSGRQAETLVVFDNDDVAWEHYWAQYAAVRQMAVSHLPLREKPVPAELIPIEETPLLQDAERKESGIEVYVPAEPAGDVEYSVPQILVTTERINPVRRQALAGLRPDSKGQFLFTGGIARQMVKVITSRRDDDARKIFLTFDGQTFNLSGKEMPLETDSADVRNDVVAWLEFFGNYENGFWGDVPRLQRDYFTFMCWFYFSPVLCDLRNAALRQGVFSFDQPMFAVLYGQSNCGKSSLIETLMTSMFSYPTIVEPQYFTRSNLRGLQEAYKRFPVVFDDVSRDRFRNHAGEIIKDETISYPEYPCFALSMNAEARNFPAEIVKRCLMIYTRTSLPGDNTTARRDLQRSVSGIRSRLTTALFREYLRQVIEEKEQLPQSDYENLDVLELSSTVLCRIIQSNLPDGLAMPRWCSPMTLAEYQTRAFERPKLVLENLLHRNKHTKERRPPVGSWTMSGDLILVSVEPIAAGRTRADIPDWILDDTASVSDQIAMNRKQAEDFLGRKISAPRRLWGIIPG